MFRNWGGEWEELQFCDDCGALETMEHILTECDGRLWRRRLWEEMSTMMTKSGLIPKRLCRPPLFGEIMGAGLIKAGKPAGTRLWATLVTETAFSIWKLRNRRRFDGTRISQRMAIDLWKASIEKRAKTDLAATKLKGAVADSGKVKNQEIGTAWRSLVSIKGGVLVWYPADYG
jgi:hypothetical protein